MTSTSLEGVCEGAAIGAIESGEEELDGVEDLGTAEEELSHWGSGRRARGWPLVLEEVHEGNGRWR